MPKRVFYGVVTSDRLDKTRRVEIPRLIKHRKYGKFIHRKTVCHVHDEENKSKLGDTVEIIECPPRSRSKRWDLVRVVKESGEVDVAAMKAARAAEAEERSHQRKSTKGEAAEASESTETSAEPSGQ